MTLKLRDVTVQLEKICATALAEPWDNVGLLIEPSKDHMVDRVMLTNDLTEDVLDEAIQSKTNLVISYHPPIFSSLKRITCSHWKQKIVADCIREGIAVFSPHTGLDAMKDGLNDWILSPFGKGWHDTCCSLSELRYSSPMTPSAPSAVIQHYFADKCHASLELALRSNIIPTLDGSADRFHFYVEKEKAEKFEKLASELDVDVQLISTQDNAAENGIFGSGKIGLLEQATSISDVFARMKVLFGAKYLKIALGRGKSMDTLVNTVAVCAGSGGSVFTKAKNAAIADLFITGEAGHHEQLELNARGATIITAGHSTSERNYLSQRLLPRLKQAFPTMHFSISRADHEPGEIL